jgi:hypothetical protein
MLALEERIINSKDSTDFAKRIIIWLLRKTQNLTWPVALSVLDATYGAELCAEMQNGAHDMLSSNGSTHLGNFFRGMGTEVTLEHHCGCFLLNRSKTEDSFEARANGRTIWFSFVYYDRNVQLFTPPPLGELEAIKLRH